MQFITLPRLTSYQDILSLMEKYVDNVINNLQTEVVYLVEHLDVYTAGTSYKQDELLTADNIPIFYTGRGGKFTFHGPGQRVIYPILNLNLFNRHKNIRLYIKMLEEWIINSLFYLGIKAYTINDKVGIWIQTSTGGFAKIAAIGIRIRKWVTYHGIAVNISTDLSKFSSIIPCGLKDSQVTSLSALGIHISMDQFDEIIKQEFIKVFN